MADNGFARSILAACLLDDILVARQLLLDEIGRRGLSVVECLDDIVAIAPRLRTIAIKLQRIPRNSAYRARSSQWPGPTLAILRRCQQRLHQLRRNVGAVSLTATTRSICCGRRWAGRSQVEIGAARRRPAARRAAKASIPLASSPKGRKRVNPGSTFHAASAAFGGATSNHVGTPGGSALRGGDGPFFSAFANTAFSGSVGFFHVNLWDRTLPASIQIHNVSMSSSPSLFPGEAWPVPLTCVNQLVEPALFGIADATMTAPCMPPARADFRGPQIQTGSLRAAP